jgi:hypothetical protein
MAKGSSSGGSQSPRRKNGKSSRVNKNQPTLNGSDTVCNYEPYYYINVKLKNKLYKLIYTTIIIIQRVSNVILIHTIIWKN